VTQKPGKGNKCIAELEDFSMIVKAWVAKGLSAKERLLTIAHELIHVQQLENLWNEKKDDLIKQFPIEKDDCTAGDAAKKAWEDWANDFSAEYLLVGHIQ